MTGIAVLLELHCIFNFTVSFLVQQCVLSGWASLLFQLLAFKRQLHIRISKNSLKFELVRCRLNLACELIGV